MGSFWSLLFNLRNIVSSVTHERQSKTSIILLKIEFIKLINIHDPRTIKNHCHDGICIYDTNFVLIYITFTLKDLGQIKLYLAF